MLFFSYGKLRLRSAFFNCRGDLDHLSTGAHSSYSVRISDVVNGALTPIHFDQSINGHNIIHVKDTMFPCKLIEANLDWLLNRVCCYYIFLVLQRLLQHEYDSFPVLYYNNEHLASTWF